MKRAGSAETLDRRNLAALILHGESEARIDALAIDENGAGAACPLIASLLRAKKMQVFAQEIKKRCANIDLPFYVALIDNPAHRATVVEWQAH